MIERSGTRLEPSPEIVRKTFQFDLNIQFRHSSVLVAFNYSDQILWGSFSWFADVAIIAWRPSTGTQ